MVLSMIGDLLRANALVVVAALMVLSEGGGAAMEIKQNGFVNLSAAEGRITSLRFDSTGKGCYGLETIAQGGAIGGVKSVTLRGNELVIEHSGAALRWEMPFVREGYYDADAHINYPDEKTLDGAAELTLPFECFIGSSGHYLRVEHFKRLQDGPRWSTLNTRNGSRMLARADHSQNWDLEMWLPGLEDVPIDPRSDRLILQAERLTGPIKILVLPRGARTVPGNRFLMPEARFVPDTPITYEPTGKTVSISQLLTDFMQMGTYWSARPNCFGEWAVGADLHVADDPRSWYLKQLRRNLLEDFGSIGYDRFGHFGYQFAWGRYPDYGAISWRPWTDDFRMLHVNGIRIMAVARYLLATGDTAFLRAKRCRTVYTDGPEPQPICGKNANTMDFVLAAGDISPDGRSFPDNHLLGQEFVASAPFSMVSAHLGNPSAAEPNKGKLRLYDRRGGKLIAETEFSMKPGASENVLLGLGRQVQAGLYYLELTDDDSGKEYNGPGITWYTELESDYTGGWAYTGPIRATVIDCIQALFDYMRNHMGAAAENMAYHQSSPEYNVGDYKSGLHLKCAPNCYWEGAGGGYDAYVAIWYNAACQAMSDLSAVSGDTSKASYYSSLKQLAHQAYRKKFWHSVRENGRTVSRFLGCVDWEAQAHDYGFSYYNLEAAYRGIATSDQTQQILWWLDRGQFSPDGGKTWQDHPYSIWELFPPFNTIENSKWLQICGTLPWLQVLTNGGNRLDCTARDLAVRSRDLSADNMHERNERVLARFASPDRLTGGRTNTEHWIGRWHFLEPDSDLADIEGFREVFPQGGIVASYQPVYYLGLEHTASGLKISPKVPSAYESVEFRNIGYRDCVFSFKAEAVRQTVLSESTGNLYGELKPGEELSREFTAPASFSKAGVQVRVRPFEKTSYNGVTVVLEELIGRKWSKVAENWMNHVRDGQWVWINAERLLPGMRQYRVVVSQADPAPGNGIHVRGTSKGPAVSLLNESTKVTVRQVYGPSGVVSSLIGGSTKSITDSERLSTTLMPGQTAELRVHQPQLPDYH